MRLILLTFCTFITLMFLTSITYRHDVPVEEYLKKAQEEPFDAVVQQFWLKDGARTSGATAVLINDRFALTAAHTLIEKHSKDSVFEQDGMEVTTYVDTGWSYKRAKNMQLAYKNQYFEVDTFYIHPDYKVDSDKNDHSPDIAVVQMREPVSGAPEISLNTQSNEEGDTVWFAGYGASCPGNQVRLCGKYGLKMAAQTQIDSLFEESPSLSEDLLLSATFQSSKADCHEEHLRDPLPLEGGVSGGDSGGGLFRETGDGWQLIGVTRGNFFNPSNLTRKEIMECFYYDSKNKWVRISAMHEWISSIIDN